MNEPKIPRGTFCELYMHLNNPLRRDLEYCQQIKEDIGIKLAHNDFKVAAEKIRSQYSDRNLEDFTRSKSNEHVLYYISGGLASIDNLDSYIWIFNESRRKLNKMARILGLPKPRKD